MGEIGDFTNRRNSTSPLLSRLGLTIIIDLNFVKFEISCEKEVKFIIITDIFITLIMFSMCWLVVVGLAGFSKQSQVVRIYSDVIIINKVGSRYLRHEPSRSASVWVYCSLIKFGNIILSFQA